jgi:hypothetical protein
MRKRMKVPESTLLRLVAWSLVRVYAPPQVQPVYNIKDVLEYKGIGYDICAEYVRGNLDVARVAGHAARKRSKTAARAARARD